MINLNEFLPFQLHGSGGHDSGGVGESLSFIQSLMGLSPSEIFSTLLPGLSGMANIHPLIVHFPIAFLIAFFLLDLSGTIVKNDNWRRLAGGLLYLGFISAGGAVIAGLIAEATVVHGENVHLILKKHKMIGIFVFGLSTFLTLWRLLCGGLVQGVQNFVYQLLAALLTILIIMGVDLGGLMVFKYGVAVEAVEVQSMDYFEEHTHSH